MSNRHRWKLKAWMVAYKGGACQLCGYNTTLSALDFHHLDPATKNFSLAGNHAVGIARIRAELDLCVLVCRNCHSEVEEALRLQELGHPLPILERVTAAAGRWAAPRSLPPFNRKGWEYFHPANWHPGYNPLLKITEPASESSP